MRIFSPEEDLPVKHQAHTGKFISTSEVLVKIEATHTGGKRRERKAIMKILLYLMMDPIHSSTYGQNSSSSGESSYSGNDYTAERVKNWKSRLLREDKVVKEDK